MNQDRVRAVLTELQSAHLLTPMRQNDEHADRLRRAAAELAAAEQMFLAGYVASQAAHVAWGDRPTMEACLAEAFGYLARATETEPRSSLEAIAALKWWSNQASLFAELAGPDAPGYRVLREEMAQRTAIVGRTSEGEDARNGFLIRGVVLQVDLDGGWSASFPDREVPGTTSTWGEGFSFEVESCFRVAIYSGDYFAANEFAELAPKAFTTPSLRGWRFAVRGLLDPEQAVQSFAAAADQFAQDVLDPASQQPWSSINVDLWAKYFRARSLVAQISRNPSALRQQVELARGALEGTESGWVDSQVTCFRVLLDALLRVVTDQPVPSFADLHRDLDLAAHAGGDEVSGVTREFLGLLEEGLQEAAEAPERAFVSGTIRRAVDALRRLPLFDEHVQVQVSDAIGERAVSIVFDRQQTWIHRTLESIRDERDLHQIILRLLQASFPHYAQVRHGPLEYGKDVVALTDDGGEPRLEMYQAKVGDISLPRWREIKPQLEEMFEVDVTGLQLSVAPQRRVGFLVFNGHIQPQAEEAVDGWRRERGLDFHVMHIDGIANWIVTRRLVGDFRAALRELGLAEVT